jgi:hypothetical protein
MKKLPIQPKWPKTLWPSIFISMAQIAFPQYKTCSNPSSACPHPHSLPSARCSAAQSLSLVRLHLLPESHPLRASSLPYIARSLYPRLPQPDPPPPSAAPWTTARVPVPCLPCPPHLLQMPRPDLPPPSTLEHLRPCGSPTSATRCWGGHRGSTRRWICARSLTSQICGGGGGRYVNPAATPHPWRVLGLWGATRSLRATSSTSYALPRCDAASRLHTYSGIPISCSLVHNQTRGMQLFMAESKERVP